MFLRFKRYSKRYSKYWAQNTFLLHPISNKIPSPKERVYPDTLFYLFARHGHALTGESPEHAQIVGSV